MHVIGPEQGATLPGMTVVCGDSHTSTHGAFGCLAFGIGTSEVEHVLATQCLVQKKTKTMLVEVDGQLGRGVTAKDIALAVIGRIGTAGGTGYAIEFGGSAIRQSVDGRPHDPVQHGDRGGRARRHGRGRRHDDRLSARPPVRAEGRPVGQGGRLLAHAEERRRRDSIMVQLDAREIKPQVTWGTSPEMVVTIDGRVPDPDTEKDATKREGMERALTYMGLKPNTPITDIRIDKVFIGSCTNSRIEDLRAAAHVVRGRRVAANVKLRWSCRVRAWSRRQAEQEGLDKVFIAAGFEWREPGCSMCLAMNDDRLEPGERCASTSNRNFEGRQGAGGRTHLVSPAMAAAAAIAGHFVDVASRINRSARWKNSPAWKDWWRRSIAPMSIPTRSSRSSS